MRDVRSGPGARLGAACNRLVQYTLICYSSLYFNEAMEGAPPSCFSRLTSRTHARPSPAPQNVNRPARLVTSQHTSRAVPWRRLAHATSPITTKPASLGQATRPILHAPHVSSLSLTLTTRHHVTLTDTQIIGHTSKTATLSSPTTTPAIIPACAISAAPRRRRTPRRRRACRRAPPTTSASAPTSPSGTRCGSAGS